MTKERDSEKTVFAAVTWRPSAASGATHAVAMRVSRLWARWVKVWPLYDAETVTVHSARRWRNSVCTSIAQDESSSQLDFLQLFLLLRDVHSGMPKNVRKCWFLQETCLSEPQARYRGCGNSTAGGGTWSFEWTKPWRSHAPRRRKRIFRDVVVQICTTCS